MICSTALLAGTNDVRHGRLQGRRPPRALVPARLGTPMGSEGRRPAGPGHAPKGTSPCASLPRAVQALDPTYSARSSATPSPQEHAPPSAPQSAAPILKTGQPGARTATALGLDPAKSRYCRESPSTLQHCQIEAAAPSRSLRHHETSSNRRSQLTAGSNRRAARGLAECRDSLPCGGEALSEIRRGHFNLVFRTPSYRSQLGRGRPRCGTPWPGSKC